MIQAHQNTTVNCYRYKHKGEKNKKHEVINDIEHRTFYIKPFPLSNQNVYWMRVMT